MRREVGKDCAVMEVVPIASESDNSIWNVFSALRALKSLSCEMERSMSQLDFHGGKILRENSTSLLTITVVSLEPWTAGDLIPVPCRGHRGQEGIN